MKKLNLFMAVMTALVTTCIILLFFCFVTESNLGWGVVTLISVVGYMISGLYFYNYKHSKEIG